MRWGTSGGRGPLVIGNWSPEFELELVEEDDEDDEEEEDDVLSLAGKMMISGSCGIQNT